MFAILVWAFSPLMSAARDEAQSWRRCPPGMVAADTFCIDKYEYPNKLGVKPRNLVLYAEAVQICLSQGKRLCTTDEWSRACSGPQKFKHPYGNEFREEACNLAQTRVTETWTWYGLRRRDKEIVLSQPALAGRYKPCVSGYGAYDMLGNYWEWTDAGNTKHTILMGGSWSTPAEKVSCLNKTETATKFYRIRNVSFRCCCDLLPSSKTGPDVQKPPK